MRKMTSLTLAVALAASLAACSNNRAPETLPPTPTETTDPNADLATGGGGTAVVRGSQADFIASVARDRVFFDTDQYNIDAADRATLDSQAAWLRNNPTVRVLIEGHADERGTRDYNIALGQRRAEAARAYLVGVGIDGSRINVISYGKERPEALGSDEYSWSQNRRAVTVVVVN